MALDAASGPINRRQFLGGVATTALGLSSVEDTKANPTPTKASPTLQDSPLISPDRDAKICAAIWLTGVGATAYAIAKVTKKN